ncbi:MAG: Stp1/IreP family PP2C-type Ser/Thr phosphatase [Muricoprocola sp.]
MESFSLTDQGKLRSMNQDYVFASDKPIGKLPNLFVVADGMGGHNAGDEASRCAVSTLLKVIRKSRERNPVRLLGKAIDEANDAVYQEAIEHREFLGMGTTLVAATIVKSTLYVANVGDSRLYVLGKKLEQVTRDHSLVEEMVRMGELTPEEARRHPDKNIITRAIGVKPTVAVDFFEVPMRNVNYVLLCSDGLTNMVSDDEIFEIIKKETDLEKAGRKLVDTANKNGGRDNITVLLAGRKNKEVKRC